jgi:hypothetical protein
MVLADLLRVVETARTPMTCDQLADRLGIDPGVVAGMLDWLSRAGRLQDDRAVPAKGRCDPSACGVAGGCGGCPFAALPDAGRRFVPARRETP